MLFKSQILTQASGSIGGTTFSRNRGGMYTRARTLPTNPNTPRQNAVRSAMTTCVNYWSNELTATERQAWKDYGDNVAVLNRVGDEIYLTGQQQFIRTNVARGAAESMITAAPTIFDTGAPITGTVTSITIEANKIGINTGNNSQIWLTNGGASDDGDIIVQFGPPVNAAVNFFKGPYQIAYTVPIAAAGTNTLADGSQDDNRQASPLVAGQFRPVRARICYDDGRLTKPWECICEVVDDAT